MFKLKQSVFRNQNFHRGLAKVANLPMRDAKTAYNIAKIVKLIEQEAVTSHGMWLKILKQYAKLDDKGEFVPRETNGVAEPGTYQVPDDKVEEFRKAEADFLSLEFTIERHPVKVSELGGNMTALEIDALEGMLDMEGADQ